MENNSNSNWVKSSQKLMEKSLEANTKIMKNMVDSFSNLISKKTDWSDLQKFNSQVFKSSMSNLVDLNLKYTESIINLNLQFSKDLSEFFEKIEYADDVQQVKSNKEEVYSEPEHLNQEITENSIQLVGKNGGTVSTKFTLNNTANVLREGTFKNTRCKSDQTGKFTNIWINFSPENFQLKPKGKQEVIISADIPKSSEQGSYRCSARIEGFDDTNFEIIVFVEAETEE